MSEEKNQNEIEEVTNEDEHKDVEHYCYLCRRPESVAGKMLELPNNIFICTDCMQRTLNSMGNGQFGFIDARNMDLDSMDITKMMNDMQSMQPKAEVKKKKKDKKEELPPCKPPTVVEVRPKVLEAEVVRFQNNKEKWVAFVGLLDGHPYEIFTGLQDDEEGISLPKSVTTGRIIKNIDEEGNKRYDFQFENKRGYKTTIEGLSEKFNKEYWNYAKLISGVLRWRMPIDRVIKLVDSLQLDSENINTWKNGVERALKKYVTDGTSAEGQKCPNCGNETLVYQEGCLICKTCGTSRCG